MNIIRGYNKKPYQLLLLTAMVLLPASILYPFMNPDFQDKTAFGLPLTTLLWIIPTLLTSIWLIYIPTRKLLYSYTLTRLHVLITGMAAILMVIIFYMGSIPSQFTANRHEWVGNLMMVLSMLFVLAQLLYPANVVLGLIGREKAQRSEGK